MSNPQHTITVSLGVGDEGLKRRDVYQKAAGTKPLSQWIRDTLDAAVKSQKTTNRR